MIRKEEILKKYFGYTEFREGQAALIDAILAGRDVVGIMPTGAGKSICYQVPALMMKGITVVVSPLISLMKDQVQALNQAGIHAAYINSSLTENQIRLAMRYAMEGRYKIIYAAPERLETAEFIDFAKTADVDMVTVDEAHCISQWGQDFRPSYRKIVTFVRQLKKRPVLSAFTATATAQVREDILCILNLQNPRVLTSGFDRKNLYFSVEFPKKKEEAALACVQEHAADSGIIYCATRKNVEKIYERLSRAGVAVTRYHAGLSQEERNRNQEDFIHDRKPVIVATNAFGMGIDKSNVRYVLHYNMPQSMENYYQEAGRAGRDGLASECILFYSSQDVAINRFLLDNKEADPSLSREDSELIRERDNERLMRMVGYCRTTFCLRKYILEYFGEYGMQRCENCSNCQKEFVEKDCTEEAKKILACVRELRQRFGINVVAGTVHGARRAKLMEYGLDKCDSYGSIPDRSESEIKEIINEMLAREYLVSTKDKYAVIRIGKQAGLILNDQDRLILRQSKELAVKQKTSRTGAARERRSDVLNGRGLELFERLRELRRELARRDNVPPYIVFNDRTLVEMCVHTPFTKEEMLLVSGVGEVKYQRYGEPFREAIVTFLDGKKEKTFWGQTT